MASGVLLSRTRTIRLRLLNTWSHCSATSTRVRSGERVRAGTLLSDGAPSCRDVLHHVGPHDAARLLVDNLLDGLHGAWWLRLHAEVIARHMLGCVEVRRGGGTGLAVGAILPRGAFVAANRAALARGDEPAVGQGVVVSAVDG